MPSSTRSGRGKTLGVIALFSVMLAESQAKATPGDLERIVYLRQEAEELWTMRVDGTDQQRVELSPIPPGGQPQYGAPAWSPDGSKLAFAAFNVFQPQNLGRVSIAIAARDGTGLRELTRLASFPAPDPALNQDQFNCPEWSPDGSRLSFVAMPRGTENTSTSVQLMTMAADGTDPRVIVDMSLDIPTDKPILLFHDLIGYGSPLSELGNCPRWSPDGTKLAFTAKRRYAGGEPPTRDAYVVGADGSGLRRVELAGFEVQSIVDWSRDGARLLFTRYPCPTGCAAFADLWSMAADGSDARFMTSTRPFGLLRLSPDGTRLYQARRDFSTGSDDFATMALDGTGLAILASPAEWDYTAPDWGAMAPASNPCDGVTCNASDECHDAGACDPATGICSDPIKSDGSACGDDGDVCTDDVCTAGACTHPGGVAAALCGTDDDTPPELDATSDVVVTLPHGSTATSMAVSFPTPTATDDSGVVTVTTSPPSGAIFPLGTTTVQVTATDGAGNTDTGSFTVTVLHDFSGFFQPVDAPPTQNVLAAGQAVAVKFSLSGDKGLNILAAGYPVSSRIACGGNVPSDDIEQTVSAGASSLTYDAAADRYSYVWKTERAWKGSCRLLVVRLRDGSEHVAAFRFR